MTGRIIKVSPKGWGFISSSDLPFTRIFFHWSKLKITTLNFADIRKGMIAEFEVYKEDNGYKAKDIMILNQEVKS